ncbi:hypothetical protein BEWA_017810 [Theileria equi strain WA]|uniref:PIPK domain-containing protein n=1 Tax=Theileria equi strain WA TaxID=1537102 RepID=L0ATS5_THEEQ|nr:hypothetical protein BEWA_017810 [Theileria equi strain WA]AFZ78940.1 hypothetical protein BEWA_017810 [Theileria equi strain WA]|eukprot:XP_004828606.1 hypothetical protein BEWA_017810 [Theileria equi strain WA]
MKHPMVIYPRQYRKSYCTAYCRHSHKKKFWTNRNNYKGLKYVIKPKRRPSHLKFNPRKIDSGIADVSRNTFSDSSVSVGIESDLLNLSKIYLRRCMIQDCELLGLETYYVDNILNLVFLRGLLAKKRHSDRDIINLVSILEITESALPLVGMNRKHRISVFGGIAFYGNLFHSGKTFQVNNCRILLTKSFLSTQQNKTSYEPILGISHSINYINRLVDKIVSSRVQLILSEDHIPQDISQILYDRGVHCFWKVKYKTLSNVAFALKCSILSSIDATEDYETYLGSNINFKVIQNGLTSIAMLSLSNKFRGFTIFISSRNSGYEHINRVKKLIKITIVRLQAIMEELQIVNDLGGTFNTNSHRSFNISSINKDIYCHYFSDFLYLLLNNDHLDSIKLMLTDSVYTMKLDNFKDKMNPKISYKRYKQIACIKCFKYYTKACELCSKPTHETISISDYSTGNFLSDFLSEYTTCAINNKCQVKNDCTETFINHKLHFETWNLRVNNVRLSLSVEHTEFTQKSNNISVEVQCNICKECNIFAVKDLTFGSFIRLLLCNKCYSAKCGHLLFQNSNFFLIAGSYRISLKVNNVSIYKIHPIFNRDLYNCLKSSLYHHGLCNISWSYNHMNLDLSTTLPSLLFWNKRSMISYSLSYLFHRAFTIVTSRINFQEKIENWLPCMCEIADISFSRINSHFNNRWLMSIRDLKYNNIVQMFDKHSVLGIEMSTELMQTMDSSLHCKHCGVNLIDSISDMDILNWIYLFTGVVNAYESKMKKLRCALAPLIDLSGELKQFYESLHKAKTDIIGIYSQCISHMIYIKYWCPRDPLHIFMIIQSFYHSLHSINKRLTYDLSLISHIEKINDLKILEFGESIIVTHSFMSDFINIERININDMSRTSSIMTSRVSKMQSIEELLEEETEQINTDYTIEQFLDLSYNYGIIFPSPGREYTRLIRKIINSAPITDNSIICANYTALLQPRRDIGNIISNSILSDHYLSNANGSTYFLKQKSFIGISLLRRIYLKALASNKSGVLRKTNTFDVKKLKYLFGINWKTKSSSVQQKLISRIWIPVIDDKVAKGYFKSALECYETKRVVHVRNFELFYGIPIIYTNHINHIKDVESRNAESVLPLSDLFIENLRSSNNEYLVKMSISKSVFSHLFFLSIRDVDTNRLLSSLQSIVINILKVNTMESFSNDLCVNQIETLSEGSNTLDVDVFDRYRVTIYYPLHFYDLRRKSCGDDFNFVRSLSRSLRMSNTGGKSGSPIFLTYDGKFTIKLINKHEMALFIAQGLRFFDHFLNGDTLMGIPYGLYKIHHKKSNTSINCFVMQNINHFLSSSKITFDIKGIAFKRFVVSNDGYTTSDTQDIVLLDQNFKEYTNGCPIQLEDKSIIHLKKNVLRDLEFLSSINIVDYSLLLHIFPEHSVITLGLIDFLRPYTWDKQIETIGKKLANIGTGQEPTIISPNEYKIRFLQFIDKIFTCSPSDEKLITETDKNSCKVEKLYSILPCMCKICSTLQKLYSNDHISSYKCYNMLTCTKAKRYIRSLIKNSSNTSKDILQLQDLVEKIY